MRARGPGRAPCCPRHGPRPRTPWSWPTDSPARPGPTGRGTAQDIFVSEESDDQRQRRDPGGRVPAARAAGVRAARGRGARGPGGPAR